MSAESQGEGSERVDQPLKRVQYELLYPLTGGQHEEELRQQGVTVEQLPAEEGVGLYAKWRAQDGHYMGLSEYIYALEGARLTVDTEVRNGAYIVRVTLPDHAPDQVVSESGE